MGSLIQLSCKHIGTTRGYTYQVSTLPPAVFNDPACEQGWYMMEGEFLSSGHLSENETRHRLVVDETTRNVTISKCIDLQHRVSCDRTGEKYLHDYQVSTGNLRLEGNISATNQTIPANHAISTHTIVVPIAVILIIIIIIIGIGILICYCKRRLNEIQLDDIRAGSNDENLPLPSYTKNLNPDGKHADQNGNAVGIAMPDDTPEREEGLPSAHHQNEEI